MRWLVVLSLVGCARDPVEDCQPLAAGDLVVTEVRGDAGADGSWVELFNASGQTADLAGLLIRFRRIDQSAVQGIPVIVRRELIVGAGEYVVLGRYLDAAKPAHVDYGFADDHPEAWLGAGAVDCYVCGDRVDVAQYSALPDVGSYSLGIEPDADLNDVAASWCFDSTPDGTPGAANTPCPPPP